MEEACNFGAVINTQPNKSIYSEFGRKEFVFLRLQLMAGSKESVEFLDKVGENIKKTLNSQLNYLL